MISTQPSTVTAASNAASIAGSPSNRVERRCCPRITTSLAATVHGIAGTNETFELHTVLDNFSADGLYLRLPRAVEQGVNLRIVVCFSMTPMPHHTTPYVTLDGVVWRVEPQADGTYGLAIMIKHDASSPNTAARGPLHLTTMGIDAPAGLANIDVSVIIPTLNEAKNLPHVLPRIPTWVHEVVLVDGCSTDDTIEVARRLRPDVRIVLQKQRGKGAALRTGFEAATGDVIVMIDADGSMDPAELPAFVGALLAGADFAKGSRFLQGAGTTDMELYRRLGNWAFVVAVRLLFGSSYSDLCYGYNAFWKRVLPQLDLDGDGFEIETMMNLRALRAGLKIVEVASFEAERVHGTSNLRTIPDGWRVLKTILRERFKRNFSLVPNVVSASAAMPPALGTVERREPVVVESQADGLFERVVGQ